jgi:hypothetical protein
MNNCFGIKDKKTGRPRDFESQEAAYAEFKALWERAYGGWPDLKKASKYVGHDGCGWITGVSKNYNRQ